MPGLVPAPFVFGELSGDVIVRFSFVAQTNRARLAEILREVLPEVVGWPGGLPPITRLITSRTWGAIDALETAAVLTPFPPLVSLNSYYRIWLRDHPGVAVGVAALLGLRPEIALAWPELAAHPTTNPYANAQTYLGDPGAPDHGIGARGLQNAAVPGSSGEGVHLIALEHGWDLRHEDLFAWKVPSPLAGDNLDRVTPRDPGQEWRVNHGTSALGVVVARDNNQGCLGIASRVASVRVTSAYDRTTNTYEHVASAIAGVIGRTPPWTVLMLQVQRDRFPTEVDDADFHAIRLAVASGLIVVEPAGNGACNLDNIGQPAGFLWPSSPNWRGDSGAIMVGAVEPPDAVRLMDTNYGERVNLYAQGTGVVTLGGAVNPNGQVQYQPGRPKSVRSDFGRTSAAAAIVTGAVCIALGVEQARGKQPPWSIEVRAGLVALGQGTPPGERRAGPTPDISRLKDANTAVYPLTPLAPNPAPPPNPGVYLGRVTGPQFSEGILGLFENVTTSGSTGTRVGDIRIPPLGGTNPHMVAGGTPVTGVTWTEHWLGSVAKVWDATDVWARFELPPPSSNPIHGTCGLAVWNSLKNLHPDYAQLSCDYEKLPGKTAPVFPAQTQVARHLLKLWNGTQWELVGEMARRLTGGVYHEYWILYANYACASTGKDLWIHRETGTVDLQTWVEGILNALQIPLSGATTTPPWFLHAQFTLVPPTSINPPPPP